MLWVLLYELVDDYLERRAPLQAAHLALAQAATTGESSSSVAHSPTRPTRRSS